MWKIVKTQQGTVLENMFVHLKWTKSSKTHALVLLQRYSTEDSAEIESFEVIALTEIGPS